MLPVGDQAFSTWTLRVFYSKTTIGQSSTYLSFASQISKLQPFLGTRTWTDLGGQWNITGCFLVFPGLQRTAPPPSTPYLRFPWLELTCKLLENYTWLLPVADVWTEPLFHLEQEGTVMGTSANSSYSLYLVLHKSFSNSLCLLDLWKTCEDPLGFFECRTLFKPYITNFYNVYVKLVVCAFFFWADIFPTRYPCKSFY